MREGAVRRQEDRNKAESLQRTVRSMDSLSSLEVEKHGFSVVVAI
jgi:hypothetical protein